MRLQAPVLHTVLYQQSTRIKWAIPFSCFFPPQVVRQWNQLPLDLTLAPYWRPSNSASWACACCRIQPQPFSSVQTRCLFVFTAPHLHLCNLYRNVDHFCHKTSLRSTCTYKEVMHLTRKKKNRL